MTEENKKILIIEDDKGYMFALKTCFNEAGFFIIPAKSAEEALAFAAKEKPDIALVDIILPGMNGIELTKKFKEKGYKFPVIFLTNLSDDVNISKAMESSPSDYLVKVDTSLEEIVKRVKHKLGVI